MCEFEFEIKHVKGKEHKIANTLRKKFHASTLSISKLDLRTRVLEAPNKDETFLQVKEKLEGKLDENFSWYHLKEYDILVYKGKLYIPNCVDLNRMIMDEIH